MISDRIARYQRERDAVFEKWENGTIDENVARVAATTITVWIEKLAWLAEELWRRSYDYDEQRIQD